MEEVLIVRVGELYLKGKNRYIFENLLVGNIKTALKTFNVKVSKQLNRIVITNLVEDNKEDVINALGKVFGISSFSIATRIDTDVNSIKSFVNNIKLSDTFKVEVKRADKTFPIHSNDFEKELGEIILNQNNNLKVDVHNPKHIVYIDIRENGETFISFEKIKGLGGMPVSSSGKGLLMLSGGIDSPVAGFLMAKRGLTIDAIYFHSHPYTSDEARQKVRGLAKVISLYSGRLNLYEVPFTKIQEEIRVNCDNRYTITVMRRIMYQITEEVGLKFGHNCLITGENLAQVASQTVQGITCSNSALKQLPMFRPLISFDKLETIELSKKIGTYDLSILPYEDCCTIFVPKNPIIKPKLDDVRKEQAKIANLDILIKQAIDNISVVKF